MTTSITRPEAEDFLFHEAALLDEWRLDQWLGLLTADAAYYVPSNDDLEGDHRSSLFTIADNIDRLRERVIRLKDRNCHAEYPRSRTRRMIANVRVVGYDNGSTTVASNFSCHSFKRYERQRHYVGRYQHILRKGDDGILIKERRVYLDACELGALGSISFIL